mmetsp:Transcript_2774/g.5561  ORF Transcript_2774/g.5561 Transcript_2774/m.5561 type:complete len:99 (+) Transcript_2774:94-390(+)
MFAAQSARLVTRNVVVPAGRQQQKRGFINWLTNYPDKVMETKRIQQAGGTCQGEYNPTWLKQPGDNITLMIGAGLCGYGLILSSMGMYKLATGKGKKD